MAESLINGLLYADDSVVSLKHWPVTTTESVQVTVRSITLSSVTELLWFLKPRRSRSKHPPRFSRQRTRKVLWTKQKLICVTTPMCKSQL